VVGNTRSARAHCPEALEVIAAAMRHKDARVRITAVAMMLERGYGKPEQKSDAEVVHYGPPLRAGRASGLSADRT
jgi:hypothetical protein